MLLQLRALTFSATKKVNLSVTNLHLFHPHLQFSVFTVSQRSTHLQDWRQGAGGGRDARCVVPSWGLGQLSGKTFGDSPVSATEKQRERERRNDQTICLSWRKDVLNPKSLWLFLSWFYDLTRWRKNLTFQDFQRMCSSVLYLPGVFSLEAPWNYRVNGVSVTICVETVWQVSKTAKLIGGGNWGTEGA